VTGTAALAWLWLCGGAIAALGCGGAGADEQDGGSDEDQLVVSAASSLEPAFTAYAEELGIDAKRGRSLSSRGASRLMARH
jgi:hypothetical protein